MENKKEEKKIEGNELKGLNGKIPVAESPLCPHCSKPLEKIRWTQFVNGLVMLVSCEECKKVIGVK